MMCCLTKILTLLAQSFSVVMAVFVVLLSIIYCVKMAWNRMFPKENGDSDGYKEQWFGRDPQPLFNERAKASVEDTSVRQFKISVPDEVLKDLYSRLDQTRYEEPVAGSVFQYGFNPKYLKKVVHHWRNEYDWRKYEAILNKFPQFKTRIEGIDVHFLHVKPDLPADSKLKIIPLMIIHGWPGSIAEFWKLIPMLTKPLPDQDFVFEVVCPSIPGYGFSESPHRQGFTARSAARIFITLMERIGHKKFYLQGGDWGSAIATIMARYYSTRILGLHLNMFFSKLKPWDAFKFLLIAFFPFLVSKDEYKSVFPIKRLLKTIFMEGGYFHMQTTKPDTIGCGMSDSPAGMAAYILEKFSFGTNPEYIKWDDGGITAKFSMDELLTNVMLYWVNNNFTAAARFYKENLVAIFTGEYETLPVVVPAAIAVFPHEVLMLPKTCMSQQLKNIVSYNIMDSGGHFAALEEPESITRDLYEFVSMTHK